MSTTASDRAPSGPGRCGRRALLVLVLAGIGAAIYVWWVCSHTLPGPDSALYRDYQRAFYVGLAALEAGREDLAREKLEQAAKLVPQEPAAWANLGLLRLRNNDLERAAQDLEQAE